MGLYIHIPYCEAKCHYCDFNSYAGREREFDAMAEALYRDLDSASESARLERPLQSVFIGGGTPSVLPGPAVARLLNLARARFGFSDTVEITSEANPGSLNGEWLDHMLEAGLTRLSMGVQSLDDDELKTLGRVHTRQIARDAVALARRAGVPSLSLDLIFGLPGQTLERWSRNLNEILDLDTDHISLYGLIIEDGTPFGRLHAQGRLDVPDDDTQAEMYAMAHAAMTARGYVQYEISNYARPGHRCRHNEMYWRNESYLGIGPGAVSYLDGWRSTRVPRPSEYVRRVGQRHDLTVECERLSPAAAAVESVMLGLRTVDGLHLGTVERRHHLPPGTLERVTRDLAGDALEAGLLHLEEGRLFVDPSALFVSSALMERFLDLPAWLVSTALKAAS